MRLGCIHRKTHDEIGEAEPIHAWLQMMSPAGPAVWICADADEASEVDEARCSMLNPLNYKTWLIGSLGCIKQCRRSSQLRRGLKSTSCCRIVKDPFPSEHVPCPGRRVASRQWTRKPESAAGIMEPYPAEQWTPRCPLSEGHRCGGSFLLIPLDLLNGHHQIRLNLNFTMSSQGKLEGKVAIVTGKLSSPRASTKN